MYCRLAENSGKGTDDVDFTPNIIVVEAVATTSFIDFDKVAYNLLV